MRSFEMIVTLAKKMLELVWNGLSSRTQTRLFAYCSSRIIETEKFRVGLLSMSGMLGKMQENGFVPLTVIDVGANVGDWSQMVASVFPATRILMIDGDPDNEPALRETVRKIGARSDYLVTLLGPARKDAVSFHRLGTGSSVLPELTSFSKNVITLTMETLDTVTDRHGLQTGALLKLDVQGFELEVLRGGKRALGLSEVVIIEVALIPYNEGAPLFAEVVAFMNEAGFVAFDFCGQLRRESDSALFQTDVAFVRRDSQLRAQRKFWLREP